jgi:hypothetical protein
MKTMAVIAALFLSILVLVVLHYRKGQKDFFLYGMEVGWDIHTLHDQHAIDTSEFEANCLPPTRNLQRCTEAISRIHHRHRS